MTRRRGNNRNTPIALLRRRGRCLPAQLFGAQFYLCSLLTNPSFPYISTLVTQGSVALIEQDLPRTFPRLSFFHDEGCREAEDLRRLLEVYVFYRPDVGYIQVRCVG